MAGNHPWSVSISERGVGVGSPVLAADGRNGALGKGWRSMQSLGLSPL